MTAISAQDALRTRICAQPGCPNESRSDSDLCDEHDAIEAAKFAGQAPAPTGALGAWTRQAVIDAIREHVREHGHVPTTSDLGTYGLPHLTSVKRLFGNLGNAVEAAGYERPTRGGRRRALPPVPREQDPAPGLGTPSTPSEASPEGNDGGTGAGDLAARLAPLVAEIGATRERLLDLQADALSVLDELRAEIEG